MLLGAVGPVASDRARLLAGWAPDCTASVTWSGGPDATVAIRPWGIAPLDDEERWANDAGTGSWLAVSGHLFHELGGAASRTGGIATRLLRSFSARGEAAMADFDGNFAIAWFDGQSRRLRLFRDRFGLEGLYYAEVGPNLVFGSRVRDILATGLLPGGLCPQGLAEYLTFCYIPSDATMDQGVRQVEASGLVTVGPDGHAVRSRWYRLSFAGATLTDDQDIGDEFRTRLEAAVVRRATAPRPGAFLSGGMDSSSVVTFLRKHQRGEIRTYSYRCSGRSFDESEYARALATAMGTEHTEVAYRAKDALAIGDVVGQMDVPFSDIGLEIGAWLLGRSAERRVDYILTGDGGDEMWASHPVYAAQRIVHRYDRLPIPRLVNRTLQRFAAQLPDSDRKRDLRVILKRILPPEALPADLRHFRWKSYYAGGELADVLVPEVAARIRDQDPFQCVRDGFKGYDGPDDGLTPCLYNDYLTLAPGYFTRLRLLRRFGIEVRSPFFDRELVEFGTRIPTRLKLEGIERTKRLFREAMEGVLPDIINHRKDKLGHSIPFKNWLRTDADLAAFLTRMCSPPELEAMGVFKPDAVARLLSRHQSRRSNDSHRLWAVVVLQLWMRNRR